MRDDENDDNNDVSVGLGSDFFSGGFAVSSLLFLSYGVSPRCVSGNDDDDGGRK